MKKQIYDYSKVKTRDYAYYGFHLKNGRYHIDTKRIIKLNLKNSFPEGLFNSLRNTHYFIPRYKASFDYAINVLKEKINLLKSDWNNEYISVIKKITTPKEVRDQYRLNEIAFTSSPDDLDEIDIDAMFAGIKRENKYNQVIRSIYLQYLQKIFTEFFRTILVVIKERGYKNVEDFSFANLCSYAQRLCSTKTKGINPLFRLPHFKYFDILNKIDNFLKHNTVRAYNALANNSREKDGQLKKFQMQFVVSGEEAGFEYENGFYAGDWIKVNINFINEILDNLLEFSKEFCELLYDEDEREALWNSDEELIHILKNQIIFML